MALERYAKIRESKKVKFGKRLRRPLNRFLAQQSLISTTRYIDPAEVPGIEMLKENWQAIRDEALAVMAERGSLPALGDISPDHRRIAQNAAWKSFFFKGHGYESTVNRARCPVTATLIDQVPDVVVAFYSIFAPGTEIRRHRGVTKAMLNVHLGLSVPAGADLCGINVSKEIRGWQEGEFLVFDETFKHEAWNRSPEPRVILFLQVMRPMRWPGRFLAKLFLLAIRHTSYVQDIRRAIAA